MTKYGMATPPTSSSSNTAAASPAAAPTETLSLPITNHKLHGENFLQWSQSVLMFIRGRGKEDYISGASSCPDSTDPKFTVWNSENNMIMSWLINSMTTEIGANFLLYPTARAIWEAADDTYSSKDNTSELFAIESTIHDLLQGDSSVTTYFTTLTRLWQQLDLFEVYIWKCPDNEKSYRAIIEQKRVFKFLMGLHSHLDDVCDRILGTQPLPSLRSAFSAVRLEESRRRIMLGSPHQSSSTDTSALIAHTPSFLLDGHSDTSHSSQHFSTQVKIQEWPPLV